LSQPREGEQRKLRIVADLKGANTFASGMHQKEKMGLLIKQRLYYAGFLIYKPELGRLCDDVGEVKLKYVTQS